MRLHRDSHDRRNRTKDLDGHRSVVLHGHRAAMPQVTTVDGQFGTQTIPVSRDRRVPLAGVDWQLDDQTRALAWAAVHDQCSADGFYPVVEADQARAPGGVCSADTVVGDRNP